MARRVLIPAAWGLMVILLAACGGSGKGTAAPVDTSPATSAPVVTKPAGAVLTLPLEVLGSGSPRTPVIAEAGLGVASAQLATVTSLWFQCHRCGFYGAPEFQAVTDLPVKIKASVRVLGGATGR